MDLSFVYVSIISTVGMIFSMMYLTYRKDIRSERAFERKLQLMERQSRIKMTELRKRTTYKQPTEKPKLDIEKLIETLAPKLIGDEEEEEEEESLGERVIGELAKNPEIRKMGAKLLKSAVDNKNDEDYPVIR